MASELGTFLASWQRLSLEDKARGLESLVMEPPDIATQPVKHPATVLDAVDVTRSPTPAGAARISFRPRAPRKESNTKVYSDIELYSYYSYLYYYPTMHWSLDKTPSTDKFWVGIFKKGAGDNEYLTYQWCGGFAEGSYYIGKLNATAGEESQNRSDEFELRIFKDDLCLDAKSNVLYGKVINPPTNPFSSDAEERFVNVQSRVVSPETRDFIRSIDKILDLSEKGLVPPSRIQPLSLDKINQIWKTFSHDQQALLFPILEQSSLPNAIKLPGPKNVELPEPQIRFPNLGRSDMIKNAIDPSKDPTKIVLTITLDYSYTYVYPVVDVHKAVPTKYAWLGVYRTQSNSYDPKGYINDDWSWVGKGEEGQTKLSYMKETHEAGTLTNHYVGPIFDWSNSAYVQIGFAGSTIQATISTSPALPPPSFNVSYNKREALLNAELSSLAYQPYSEVVKRLRGYNLEAKMQIFDYDTDTDGFIASNDSLVVVAFRGTSSVTNVATDLSTGKKRITDRRREMAHAGFVTALNTVYNGIAKQLKSYKGKKLYVTGHSLGAALASLLTFRLRYEANICPTAQFVYGCPPVGDIEFAKSFSGLKSHTITIVNDLVSSGEIVSIGAWLGYYKPELIEFLPKSGGHGIAHYIEQLKSL